MFALFLQVVAWDAARKQILPFQVLSTRKKKNVQEADVEVSVCLFAFDCLFLNGVSLISQPFGERRTMLHGTFREVPGEFHFAEYKDTNDLEEIQSFLQEAITNNCEGLMVKSLVDDSNYIPNKRNWLKRRFSAQLIVRLLFLSLLLSSDRLDCRARIGVAPHVNPSPCTFHFY